MKLKYYMRGLGIGVLVTVFLMSAALKGKGQEPMTDGEIRERAAALGMVEQGGTLLDKLSDVEPQEEDGGKSTGADAGVASQEKDAVKDAGTESQEKDAADGAGTASQEKDAVKDAGTESQEKDAERDAGTASQEKDAADGAGTESQEKDAEKDAGTASREKDTGKTAGERTPFVIASGTSSYGVSKALADAGLVENASDFDSYLCQNGFDSKICAGSFEIPKGATKEQIAGIITGQNGKDNGAGGGGASGL